MTLYLQKLYIFVRRDKLFLKCHIQLNQLWFLMQRSYISGYFYDFAKERTMMLEVIPDDDLWSMAHERKKEQEEDILTTLTSTMPSTSVLALSEYGNVLEDKADSKRTDLVGS
ncbi:hypothetical protein B296_00013735 [Ensete ventricosum]|uniref:Uncharacterized protein n=1 Tax=Ensete ventricosum TaxID=4639 RepID=A0A427A0M7_ENSVE|nr:hypothetical protein B296_00013735 [Ensete ventricosum]